MPYYEFECEEHGSFEEFQLMSEYTGMFECPQCNAECTRAGDDITISMGRMGGHTTGGNERSYGYMQGAEENWLKDEIKHIKKDVLSQEAQQKGASPYSNFMVTDPAAAGFKKVDSKTAKKRMENAKKFVKDVQTKNEAQKKDSNK